MANRSAFCRWDRSDSTALFGGICVVLGFPPFGLVPLLFLGLYFLFRRTANVSPARGIRLGLIFGLAVQAGGFYWISGAVAKFYSIFLTGGDGGGSSATFLGLGAFLIWWIFSTIGWGIWGGLLAFAPQFTVTRVAWTALSLMALEALYPRVFPWNLGAGVVRIPWLAQGAWWCGVEGLTGVIAVVAAIFAEADRSAPKWKLRLRSSAIVILVIWSLGGAIRASGEDAGGSTVLRIGYVQAMIGLEERHSRDLAVQGSVVEKIVRMTREVYEDESPDVVIWSEGMLPSVATPEEVGAWVRARIRAPLVIGGLAERDDQTFNCAFVCLDPGGDGVRYYNKRTLVPFGEEIPGQGLLKALGVPVPSQKIGKGNELLIFELSSVPVSLSICFEGILRETSHEIRRSGARLHLNLTEDLWYGESSAPYQHLALTRMRAIEAGVPLVRITNGGISATCDRRGRMREGDRIPLGGLRAGIFEIAVPDLLPDPPWTQLLFRYSPILLLPIGIGIVRSRRRGANSGVPPADDGSSHIS